jgi:hypothetical protein
MLTFNLRATIGIGPWEGGDGFRVWCAHEDTHNSGDEAELLQLNSNLAISDSCALVAIVLLNNFVVLDSPSTGVVAANLFFLLQTAG